MKSIEYLGKEELVFVEKKKIVEQKHLYKNKIPEFYFQFTLLKHRIKQYNSYSGVADCGGCLTRGQ